MRVDKAPSYIRSKKKFQKDKKLLAKINKTEAMLIDNHMDTNLHFKKINCKINKDRHSVRIHPTGYRILMSYQKDLSVFTLVCVCDHDKYELHNKNC